VSKTNESQLDAFKLYFTPTAGGPDVIRSDGYCTTNLSVWKTTLIEKPVKWITNLGSEPTVGFIFHYTDGTTT
jgi:hypothetical protein